MGFLGSPSCESMAPGLGQNPRSRPGFPGETKTLTQIHKNSTQVLPQNPIQSSPIHGNLIVCWASPQNLTQIHGNFDPGLPPKKPPLAFLGPNPASQSCRAAARCTSTSLASKQTRGRLSFGKEAGKFVACPWFSKKCVFSPRLSQKACGFPRLSPKIRGFPAVCPKERTAGSGRFRKMSVCCTKS